MKKKLLNLYFKLISKLSDRYEPSLTEVRYVLRKQAGTKTLTRRELDVMFAYVVCEDLERAGKYFNITMERVRQIINKGCRKYWECLGYYLLVKTHPNTTWTRT